MKFAEYQKQYALRVNHVLTDYLSVLTAPADLLAAMQYAVLNGGKRLRPLLVYATGSCLDVAAEQLDAAASAVEFIHAYSLVHDDLPALDNDDLRRGLPTCHKKFGEATAILVGDALQTCAFQYLAHATSLTEQQRLRMISVLTTACGATGMVAGQALDLAATGATTALTLAELTHMHRCKTGALIHACVQLAALAANHITPEHMTALEQYALAIGLAFQIQDDILDIVSSTAVLGKQQGADLVLAKSTYPHIMGLAAAKQKVVELQQEALLALNCFGDKARFLQLIAQYITERDH